MSDDRPVWYAAYGSNLSRDRFLRYLVGGPIPHSPSQQTQEPARDRSAPSDNRPFVIDRRLFFACASQRWGGGGVAFLDADRTGVVPTKGRAWRITLGQLEDVFRQENGQSDLIEIDLDQLVRDGSSTLLQCWYGRLVCLGELEGLPVLTLATPSEMLAGTGVKKFTPRPAHISYLRVIAQGLNESLAMTTKHSAEYLSSLPGNDKLYGPDQLAEELAAFKAS